MLPGLIMDMPLMISSAIQYAATYHGETEVVARGVDGAIHRYNYAEAERACDASPTRSDGST